MFFISIILLKVYYYYNNSMNIIICRSTKLRWEIRSMKNKTIFIILFLWFYLYLIEKKINYNLFPGNIKNESLSISFYSFLNQILNQKLSSKIRKMVYYINFSFTYLAIKFFFSIFSFISSSLYFSQVYLILGQNFSSLLLFWYSQTFSYYITINYLFSDYNFFQKKSKILSYSSLFDQYFSFIFGIIREIICIYP